MRRSFRKVPIREALLESDASFGFSAVAYADSRRDSGPYKETT
jgi:hypothetical protein